MRCEVLSITPELAAKRTLSDCRILLLLASAVLFRATGTPSIKRTFPEEENLVKSGCQLEKTNHGIEQQNDFILLSSSLLLSRPLRRKADRCLAIN